MDVPAIDPLDALFLESLLPDAASSTSTVTSSSTGNHNTPLGRTHPSISTHSSLSAFLAELDALHRDGGDSEQDDSTAGSSDVQENSNGDTRVAGDADRAAPATNVQTTEPVLSQSRAIAIALERRKPVRIPKRRIRAKEELDSLRVELVQLQQNLKE